MINENGKWEAEDPRPVHYYYIVPGDVQCRVVYGKGDLSINSNLSPRDSYNKHPECWKEVGVMNHTGKLVCFEGHHPNVYRLLVAQQPLMGGSSFMFNNEGEFL